ncbi:dinuclear metal center YbgI/SA1388 family protein [Chromohalobacter marismortui]|uniref:GTP cyclohydrolase 1 type 2 homolog n=1 Tax=Chromohalobacter marismortui TaxID=42055 RepID=A0A4R7NQU1_9GAMM|nr:MULTISPECIES: Nif3-like dinuclear metal center hexameric protein [Chromohalobacter]MCI0508543.1 Nif3-like dinuclear metal center hexameric protein [Chromohalobacter sp.]MCI0592498.1 Nif3-like dinuclear metal center hexameric protein [Chromohalobacter sp.]TDU23022.1 dinuclear metal center YbgI/SA1388 family protein [Chromohalobacter marismortui]
MSARQELIAAIESELEPGDFKDYTLNGLQVEGRDSVSRVLSGVTANQALLDEAVAWNADLVLVHHGYFWKNEPVAITGMKRRRLATLMAHDINLAAYHLPLDAHATLGNNAQLAERLDLTPLGCLDGALGRGLLWYGDMPTSMAHDAFAEHVERRLGRAPLVVAGHARPIARVAWCTGGAQDMLPLAAEAGVDAFVSGEISERTTHMAREMGVSYVAAGHHATERDGVRALGDWLASRFAITHRFVDIDNPA